MYSGAAIRYKRYAPGLRARGVDMRVVSGAWPDGDRAADESLFEVLTGDYGRFVDEVSVDGIPVSRVLLPARSNRRLMTTTFDRALLRLCRRPGSRPDVAQVISLVPWSIPWLWRIRQLGVPLVHAWTQMDNPALGPMRRRFKRMAYRFVDCVIVQSTVMRDALRERGVEARIEVIPNGVDVRHFRPAEEPADTKAVRRRLEIEPGAEMIACIGGVLNRRKGVDVLSRAWRHIASQCPRAHLVLIGPEFNELRPKEPQREFLREVRRNLRESGAMDRVRFTGRVDDMAPYLQAADLFVFPSRREGMPNAVAEAFACGTPTVLTPFDGLPREFGRPGRHYVLTERTPETVASSVCALLANGERRRSLGRAARRWVEENLDVEESLDRYAALYHEIAKRGATT